MRENYRIRFLEKHARLLEGGSGYFFTKQLVNRQHGREYTERVARGDHVSASFYTAYVQWGCSVVIIF